MRGAQYREPLQILSKYQIPLQVSLEYRHLSKDESTFFIVAMICIVNSTKKNISYKQQHQYTMN